MQIYTHLVIGASTGALLYPDNPTAQAVCIIGAVTPDVILGPKFVLDKLRGKQAFVEQSAGLLQAIEVVNSIPYGLLGCLLACLFTLKFPSLTLWTVRVAWLPLAFFASYTGHLVIDALTHSGKEYRDTDPSYLYFWPFWCPKVKLGNVIGIWEYRYGHGILKPKPAETLILSALCTFTACLWLL